MRKAQKNDMKSVKILLGILWVLTIGAVVLCSCSNKKAEYNKSNKTDFTKTDIIINKGIITTEVKPQTFVATKKPVTAYIVGKNEINVTTYTTTASKATKTKISEVSTENAIVEIIPVETKTSKFITTDRTAEDKTTNVTATNITTTNITNEISSETQTTKPSDYVEEFTEQTIITTEVSLPLTQTDNSFKESEVITTPIFNIDYAPYIDISNEMNSSNYEEITAERYVGSVTLQFEEANTSYFKTCSIVEQLDYMQILSKEQFDFKNTVNECIYQQYIDGDAVYLNDGISYSKESFFVSACLYECAKIAQMQIDENSFPEINSFEGYVDSIISTNNLRFTNNTNSTITLYYNANEYSKTITLSVYKAE